MKKYILVSFLFGAFIVNAQDKLLLLKTSPLSPFSLSAEYFYKKSFSVQATFRYLEIPQEIVKFRLSRFTFDHRFYIGDSRKNDFTYYAAPYVSLQHRYRWARQFDFAANYRVIRNGFDIIPGAIIGLQRIYDYKLVLDFYAGLGYVAKLSGYREDGALFNIPINLRTGVGVGYLISKTKK